MNENETNFISIVKNSVYRAPKPREKSDPEKVFSGVSKELKELISMKPSLDIQEKLQTIFFNDTPEDSEFDVFYFVSSNITEDIDDKLILSYILNTLATSPGDFYVIAEFSHLIPSKIEAIPLKKLFASIPANLKKSFKQLIILQSSRDLVQYYNKHKQLFPYDEILFIQSVDDIPQSFVFSDKLPLSCKEALLNDGSLQDAIINGNNVTIRVSRYSIHINETIDSTYLNDIILLKDIAKVSELTAVDNNTLAFTITTHSQMEYVFTTFPASGLYHVVVSAFERANRKEVKYPQICTDSSDTSSSKWLLMIIALIGLVNTSDCKYLQQTSFQLLQSVIAKYGFPITLPSNASETREKAYNIMKECAEAYPQDAGHFIIEIEKVMNFLDDPYPLFLLLSPWASTIAQGYGGYPTLRYLIELHSDDSRCQKVIEESIWPSLMEDSCIRNALEVFYPVATQDMDKLLFAFANTNKTIVSEFAISELSQRRQNAPIISMTLIKSELFDFDSYKADLIHTLYRIRIAVPSRDLIANLTSEALIYMSIPIDEGKIQSEMLDNDDNICAKSLIEAIGNDEIIKKRLMELFEADISIDKESENSTQPGKQFIHISSPTVFISLLNN